MKLEFQPKIEFPKLDLCLDSSYMNFKKKLLKKKTTWNSSVVTSSSILKKFTCKELGFVMLKFTPMDPYDGYLSDAPSTN